MSSGFQITGIKELEKAINEAYSGARARRIRKDALNAGGDLVTEELKKNFESFKDTGASMDEIVRTNAKSRNDIEELAIGWNGPRERWRLVHLNEFGYTKKGKQYTPAGFGVISKTIQDTQEKYFSTVSERMKKSL